jgi:hypothetical protein
MSVGSTMLIVTDQEGIAGSTSTFSDSVVMTKYLPFLYRWYWLDLCITFTVPCIASERISSQVGYIVALKPEGVDVER